MFIDSRSLTENAVVETDVTIIGGGAAGITLALEFADQQFRVCLLESGGFEFDNETHSLNKGENIGLPYGVDTTRARYFGGTTNLWSGQCRPLDQSDFECQDWIPFSGWPFGKDQLNPFYERAQTILQLGPYAYDEDEWTDSKKNIPLPFESNRLFTTIFKSAPRQDLEPPIVGK